MPLSKTKLAGRYTFPWPSTHLTLASKQGTAMYPIAQNPYFSSSLLQVERR
jgi:hypothetical protein